MIEKVSRAIFVTHFVPKPVGHGGDHRAYQVVHDLEEMLGAENVIVLSLPQWLSLQAERQAQNPITRQRLSGSRLRGRLHALNRRVHFMLAKDPIDLLAGSGQTLLTYMTPRFVEYYRQIASAISQPAVCIIEHVSFADIMSINSELGIASIACIQNIESFDRVMPTFGQSARRAYYAALDFVDEYRALARYDARLFISRVETALIGGLGLGSHYYPYLPVGKIRQNLECIRQVRSKEGTDRGLFLMLGSASHSTTRESFLWFIENARRHGLPKGITVIIAGSNTDKLIPLNDSVSQIELRGWLEQTELDGLLARARAVLVPQKIGFGAVTRLAELAAAAIPTLVSRHVSYAIDLPPGVQVLDDDWGAWYEGMQQLTRREGESPKEEYLMWEQRQPRTLQLVVRNLMEQSTRDQIMA